MNRLTDCTSLSYIRITLFTVYNGFTVGGLTKGHAGTNTRVWIVSYLFNLDFICPIAACSCMLTSAAVDLKCHCWEIKTHEWRFAFMLKQCKNEL